MNESAHPFRFQIVFQPIPLGTSYDILMPNVFSLTSRFGKYDFLAMYMFGICLCDSDPTAIILIEIFQFHR